MFQLSGDQIILRVRQVNVVRVLRVSIERHTEIGGVGTEYSTGISVLKGFEPIEWLGVKL